MKISTTIRIAGYDYKVIRPESPFVSGDKPCDGSFNFSEQEIKVSRSGNINYQQTVFLHELTHALIEHYCSGAFYNIDDEEQFVEHFSKGLYQLITENPEIFKGEEFDICRDTSKAKED